MALLTTEAPLICLAGNPVIFEFNTDETAQDYIGIHIQVQEYQDSSWVDVGPELRYEPDTNGDVEVDVSDIINWEPDNSGDDKLFHYPQIDGDVIAEAAHLIKQYRVVATEKYGNPLEEGDSTTTNTRYALPGGESFMNYGAYNEDDADYESWYDYFDTLTLKPFLTDLKTKKTNAFAHERLYFLAASAITNLRLELTRYYSDGSTDNDIVTNFGAVSQYSVVEIDASAAAVQAFYADSEIVEIDSYTLQLFDWYDEISEIITFTFDKRILPDAVYLLFSNKYNMPEGIFFDQLLEGASEFEHEDVEVIIEHDHKQDAPGSRMLKAEEKISFQLNSGYRTKEEIIHYRNFMLSKQKFLLLIDSNIPVIGKTDKTIKDKRNHLFNAPVTLYPTFKNQFASPEAINPRLLQSIPEEGSGDNLITEWENGKDYPFDTFTSDGADITQAVCDFLADAYTNQIADVTTNKVYHISFLLSTEQAGSFYIEFTDAVGDTCSDTIEVTVDEAVTDQSHSYHVLITSNDADRIRIYHLEEATFEFELADVNLNVIFDNIPAYLRSLYYNEQY